MTGVGGRDHRVGAEDQQGPGPVRGAQGVQEFVRAAAGAGQGVRVDPPDPGDMGAGRRVGDHAVAGQLVGLLAVLAPALAVALAGEAAVAAALPAGHAQGQGQVDEGGRGVGPLAVLLHPAPAEEVAPVGPGQHPYGPLLVLDRDAGHLLDPLGPPGQGTPPGLVEPRGPGVEILLVQMLPGHRDVQQAERQGEIGAGRGLEVQRRLLGGTGAARIDDDQPGADQMTHQRGHGLGRVGPGQHDHVRLTEIGDGERQPPVQAEGRVAGGRRRGHAEAAVVVDLAGAERDPGELPQRVSLLVGQPPPPKTPTPSGPYVSRTRSSRSTTRSRASSQLAGASSPSAPRIRGCAAGRGC